ncbi:DUF6377 domain-containing protein [Duncaniella freteri]|uniref:DUF6377 domain-containing protein n=1 Tax=Duncaniella freteri TaxID=2530391 RepID=UPI002553117D|nr:DUF6377 domain-containing protein [Duncaniella freteri]
MMFLRIIITIFAIFPLITSAKPTIDERDVARMLKRLDSELERCDIYIESRTHTIDSLKSLLSNRKLTESEQIRLMFQIGEEYNAYKVDSALIFYNRGYEMSKEHGNDSIRTRFAIKRATFMPLLLFITNAQSIMDSISEASVPKGMKAEYYDARRQMYNYISNFYSDYSEVYREYRDREIESQKTLIKELDHETPQYRLNYAEHLFYSRKFDMAERELTSLVADIDDKNPLYARACHLLSDISNVNGDYHGRIYYLALSAISDIRCATLEVSSLQELGRLLYSRDDIKRAHDYLSHALQNAVNCKVALRIIQTSQEMPIIENAHRSQIQSFRTRIFVVIAILAVLLIALYLTFKTVKKKNEIQHRMSSKLAEANRTKDVYLSQFLNLCSTYMDNLNQFSKLVNRKISAGKGEDLLKLTKSGKFVEEQSKEFYRIFDDAFLHIYPTFVEDVNSLLLPEKKLTMRDGEKLNTDLRILALMRLGIEDTSRIAQMLNYSVYTIYTYRNKFKSRAIDRDSFEEEVMRIKSI